MNKKIIIGCIGSVALIASLSPVFVKDHQYIEGTNISRLEAEKNWSKTEIVEVPCLDVPGNEEDYKFVAIEKIESQGETEEYFVFERNNSKLEETLFIINNTTKLPTNTEDEIYEVIGFNEQDQTILFQEYQKKGKQKNKSR